MTTAPGPGGTGDAVMSDDPTAVFAEHRSLLFTVAYEMLGSAVDAEDVVQETWVRWAAARAGRAAPDESDPDPVVDLVPDTDATTDDLSSRPEPLEPIRFPRAYLVRITTRLALNRLRSIARRREDYIGPWLPEPLLTAPDVVDDVLLTESVSLAMLVVMESLAPAERAVFVLREVFGFDYDEIAGAVGRTSANVRQIAHRAREHVQARRPRFEPDKDTVRAVMQGFQQAMFTGDIQALMDLMAPDVVLLSDGGGRRSAARRPVFGHDKVAAFVAGIFRKGAVTGGTIEIRAVNGHPAWAFVVDGVVDGLAQLVIEDGLVRQVLVVVNPDKLVLTQTERALTRES